MARAVCYMAMTRGGSPRLTVEPRRAQVGDLFRRTLHGDQPAGGAVVVYGRDPVVAVSPMRDTQPLLSGALGPIVHAGTLGSGEAASYRVKRSQRANRSLTSGVRRVRL